MPNRIRPARSTTAGAVPAASRLSTGELAVNLADRYIYVKDGGNNIVKTNAGKADTATKLGNAVTINGVPFDGTEDITVPNSLGFTPVQQGGGNNQGTNKIYIGHDGSAPRIQVDATDFGQLWHDSNGWNKIAATGAVTVGAYAFLQNQSGVTLNTGDTVAGSSLRYSSHNLATGISVSGTWRCMGYCNHTGVSVFLRIS